MWVCGTTVIHTLSVLERGKIIVHFGDDVEF